MRFVFVEQKYYVMNSQMLKPRRYTVSGKNDLSFELISTVFILLETCVFTARCTLVQSAVLRSHVVCLSFRPSVRPSVTLVNCDHIGWNSSKIISRSVSLGCSLFATQTSRGYSKGNTQKFPPE